MEYKVHCFSSPGIQVTNECSYICLCSSYVPSWHALGHYLPHLTIVVWWDVTPCNLRDKRWSPSKRFCLPDYTPSHNGESRCQNITSNKTNLSVKCIHQHISEIIFYLIRHFIHFYRVREGTVRYHFVFEVSVVRINFYTRISSDVLYLVA